MAVGKFLLGRLDRLAWAAQKLVKTARTGSDLLKKGDMMVLQGIQDKEALEALILADAL